MRSYATNVNEYFLTNLKKSVATDCLLLSVCVVTEASESKAIVIGIGMHSQWGKIKAHLVTEAVNTPLQEKLESMTKIVKILLSYLKIYIYMK